MMKYNLVATDSFRKEFKKLDKYTQRVINAWIVKNILNTENPRLKGKALVSNRAGQWRYRIGDYRLICQINDNELIILAIAIGHRREIYSK